MAATRAIRTGERRRVSGKKENTSEHIRLRDYPEVGIPSSPALKIIDELSRHTFIAY
jgi:hypothetical protein